MSFHRTIIDLLVFALLFCGCSNDKEYPAASFGNRVSGSSDQDVRYGYPVPFLDSRSQKWGYMSRDGCIEIDGRFDSARLFSERRAAVKVDGLWGFIDETGTTTTLPSFDTAKDFAEGRAVVSRDGKYGYIDYAGDLVIPLKYDNARSFSEGLAAVCKKENPGLFPKSDEEYNSWAYISTSGEIVIPFKDERDIARDFEGGMAAVATATIYEPEWDVINREGESILGEGIWRDTLKEPVFGNGKVYVYTTEGKALLTSAGKVVLLGGKAGLIFRYENGFFLEGTPIPAGESMDRSGWIYETYQTFNIFKESWIVTPEGREIRWDGIQHIYPAGYNRAFVIIYPLQIRLTDLSGNIVGERYYYSIGDFNFGRAFVRLQEKGHLAMIDTTGEPVTDEEFLNSEYLADGVWKVVRSDETTGYINANGDFLEITSCTTGSID